MLVDNLASRVPGDEIVIDAITTFSRSENSYVLYPQDVSTTARGNHDSDVRRAFVRQTCFCSKENWADQTVQATMTLTTVAPDRIAGTVELTTTGGLPFFGYFPVTAHTTHFSGAFDTQSQ